MTEAGRQHLVDAPLAPPAPRAGLIDVFRRRYLLWMLVRREISARYQGSFLGLLWSYVNPLTQFCIYYFVMGVLFNLHKDVENFAIHMFCGITIVHFFNETFNAGTRSIVRNKAMVQKMAMPREMFPVASMLVSAYHIVPQLVILVIVCVWSGWTPEPAGMVALLLSLAIIIVMGTAMALLFSAANVFFRDVSNVAQIMTNFVRFGVPMIYPYSLVAERFHGHTELYLANPIADAVLLLQRAFWVGTTDHPAETIAAHLPDHLFTRGVIALGISLVILGVGQLVFSRLQNKIPERL
jgi:ABC-2 type transport system permease protein